uniref:ATP synthase epsilon chain, chloroplastic n=1 Tax=Boldia erythrosiphon TaxID=74908 RepID=A0A1Y9TLM9_9RHOD|nr:ATP synthase CF1 subunit epsilon [Boldia erythrosiphon]ARO90504.1 ATP synthase CF1 subunit epsilon [Boldia erythrosiphon]
MTLSIEVITPDRTVWNAKAEEVILPSSTGQLGILTGHAPLLTALDIGVMRVRIEKEWLSIVLMGGFAEIVNNKLTILVNSAEEAKNIDSKEANINLDKALNDLEKAESPKTKIEATQNLRKARARFQAASLI